MLQASPTTFAIIGLVWLALLALIYPVALKRGRDPAKWMLIGFVLSPILVILILLARGRRTAT